MELVAEPISSDCSRALGMRFENYDASKGWSSFLESKGVSIPTQKLHYRLFTHCAVQATCTQFDEGKRRTITQGAMEVFLEKRDDYDFGVTYNALESAYRGQHKFDQRVEPLNNSDATVQFLPNPKVAVLNAKYLIEVFVFPHMPNSAAFVDQFQYYSSTVFASIGTVTRAIDYIFKSFKI